MEEAISSRVCRGVKMGLIDKIIDKTPLIAIPPIAMGVMFAIALGAMGYDRLTNRFQKLEKSKHLLESH